jgi:hypothetical protein
MYILAPPNPDKFISTAMAIYVVGTAFVQVAVNTVINGYVVMIFNYLSRASSQLK